jgi:hypothetical protein
MTQLVSAWGLDSIYNRSRGFVLTSTYRSKSVPAQSSILYVLGDFPKRAKAAEFHYNTGPMHKMRDLNLDPTPPISLHIVVVTLRGTETEFYFSSVSNVCRILSPQSPLQSILTILNRPCRAYLQSLIAPEEYIYSPQSPLQSILTVLNRHYR